MTCNVSGNDVHVCNRSGDAGHTIKMAGSSSEFVLHYVPKEY